MKFLLLVLSLWSMNLPFCSCLPPEKISEEDFQNYDLIVKGTIKDISIEGYDKVLCLEVDVLYKGDIQQQSVLVSTPSRGGYCGLNAGIGDPWLIFAFEKKDQYSSNICTRSKNLNSENHMYRHQKEEIAQDLSFLEKKLSEE